MKKKTKINSKPANSTNLLLCAVSESDSYNKQEVRKHLKDEEYDFEIIFNLLNGRQTSPYELS